jgi:hypothetical protein
VLEPGIPVHLLGEFVLGIVDRKFIKRSHSAEGLTLPIFPFERYQRIKKGFVCPTVLGGGTA